MNSIARRIVADPRFERLIIGLIVFNGVLVGLETSHTLADRFGGLIGWLHHLVLAVFIAEVVLKIWAVAPDVRRYFADGWNLFDFTVVVLSLIPFTGELSMIARLVRLLRVLRLVSALPKLRLVVATLVHALPGMGHVLLLVALLFYVYAVAGWHLFHVQEPERWGTLGMALLTLFQVATLESWTSVMRDAMAYSPYSWIYFVSFVICGTFVVINLFVAVVINSLEEAKATQLDIARPPASREDILAELRAAREALARLEERLDGDLRR
jgi:voltage-gated sodium channel